ncbi:MAG TPA: BatD family protein [candidate division Zixibacteria bacterium]|nr:BatD family protein [candidate division Zixibacteria bacterium]
MKAIGPGLAATILLLFETVAAEGLSVSQALDKSHLAFEDSAVFTITLSWPGPQFAYRFPEPLDPTFEKLQVTRFETAVASQGTGAEETTHKTFRYTLAPLAPGTGRIAPVTISYVTYPDSIPGEAVTEPMTVAVERPAAAPEDKPRGRWWLWLAGALAAAGAGAAVVIRKARRPAAAPPVKTPADTALEQLDRLHVEAAGDLKKFQAGLYRVLAEFLRARFNIDADVLDDSQLAQAVRGADLRADVRDQLAAWIVTARQDKFRPVAGAPGETVRREAEVREALQKVT